MAFWRTGSGEAAKSRAEVWSGSKPEILTSRTSLGT